MRRRVWLSVLLGTASLLVVPYGPEAILKAQTSPSSSSPQVKATVEVVQVDVSVVDAAGHPVPDLVAEDFTLEEDGVAQTIEAFESATPAESAPAESWTRDRVSTNTSAASSGRTFMLVFDDLQLSPRGAERARAAAAEFIKSLGRGDRVGATSTSGRVWSSGALPRDREAVLSAMKRVEGMRPPESRDADQMSDYEAMRIAEYNDSVVLRSVENRLGRDQNAAIQSWAVDPMGGPAEIAPGPFSGGALGPGAGSGDRNPRRSLGSVSSEKMLAQTLATQLYERVKQRRGQVLQSITRVLGSLGRIEGRKAVILLSEGFLHDPDDRRFAALSNACRRVGATIYAFDIGGLLGSGGEAGQQRTGGRPLDERAALRAGLESVASESGGFAVTNTNDPAGGLERVVEESSHYYLLGYRSTKGPPDGKYRRIRVSVRRPGVEVRARPGYFALAEAGSAGAGGGAAEAGLRLREARDAPAPLSGLPLRMSSYTFDRTREGTTRTLLVSEVRLDDVVFEEKKERLAAELDILLTVTDAATGRTLGDRTVPIEVTSRAGASGQNVWYRFNQEVGLSPGSWQARLVVRDRKSGLIGSVIHPLEVPGEGTWRVSSPVISDALAPEPDREAFHALPLARRTFPAAGLLHCEFQVYGKNVDRITGVPRVAAGVSILREGGKAERNGELSVIDPGPDRRLERLVTVPLRGLKPGNYELVLHLKDEVTGETQDLREPFSLARPDRPTMALYEDVLQDYLEGRAEEAVGTVLAWRTEDVTALAKKAAAGKLSRVAVMFHTEAALALMTNAQSGMAGVHLDIARTVLEKAERDTPFRRDWLLALGSQMQALAQETDALRFFLECESAFPQVAEAWLGAGTVYEFSAFPDGLGGSPVGLAPAESAREAERHYRRALALDPSLTEAHLRLGRVLQRGGRTQEASSELKLVADGPEGGPTAALALLFLGQILEQEGQATEAVRRYRAALEQDPTLQQAGVALAGILGIQGDRGGAVEALAGALNEGCPVGPPRWLLYHLGLGARAAAAVDALRRTIRS